MAGDLGDPLLNAWILVWGANHATAILGGDLGAFSGWWNANIFHPSPLALAYSEHLAPQVVAGLPIWWLTHNVLLVSNLLVLASTVLSGLGTFLLVRELTGRPRAALVAGLFFAFVPYRLAQAAHLQVLWSQWMPFTLYALRCYFERGRRRALVGALAALVAQQLSCGYYLIYFSPFVALYIAWEISARRRWRDSRLLTAMAVVAAADVAIIWPFLSPYLELRGRGFSPRPLQEVAGFSADTMAYFAVHQTNRVWGSVLRTLPRPENELFAGAMPLVMAALGLAAMARARWTSTADLSVREGWRRWVLFGCGALAAAGALTVLILLATGGLTVRLADVPLRVRTIDRGLTMLAVALGGLLLLSRRARAWCRWGTDARGCALLLLGLAVVLSWGPEPRTNGRALQFTGPYLWLYQHVPGVDGLRVPARLAMVAYVFLAVLGGYGLAVARPPATRAALDDAGRRAVPRRGDRRAHHHRGELERPRGGDAAGAGLPGRQGPRRLQAPRHDGPRGGCGRTAFWLPELGTQIRVLLVSPFAASRQRLQRRIPEGLHRATGLAAGPAPGARPGLELTSIGRRHPCRPASIRVC